MLNSFEEIEETVTQNVLRETFEELLLPCQWRKCPLEVKE